MENRENLDGSYLPAASWTAQLPQEELNWEYGAEHFSVEELFNFSDMDDYASLLPVDDDNNGGSKAVKDQCSASFSASTVTPTTAFCDNCNSDNTPYSDEPTCRVSIYRVRRPGGLCEPEELLPEEDWMSYLAVEPYSQEEPQKQQLINSGITATSSQPTHQVDYPFSAVDVEMPPFAPEVTVPDKAVIGHKRNRSTESSYLDDPTTERPSLVHSDAGIINPNPDKPPAKKKETSPDGVARRCRHCGTEKTPQWRAGPAGPKSLCNACGVRFKSGRLVPEYRPASSPTFEVSEHSNSHRKVVELRRRKGIPTHPHPPVNQGVAASAEGAAAAAMEAAAARHNFLIYQHRYLPDFLTNF